MEFETKLIALIGLGLSAANFILTWGVALYMYLANKNKVTNERINKLQADIDSWKDDHAERIAVLETKEESAPTHGDIGSWKDDHAERIAVLEAKAESAPTHDDLGELHEKVNEVSGQVREIGGMVSGIDANVRQMMGRIMERGMP